jgi:epothilone polyketide synthase D
VTPSSVAYVECHGTGTALGDPIEVQAAGAVLGEGRDLEHPLVLGSLKSNIGHTEAAAGVGGLIKAVLALEHERIPKSLHVGELNPHIPWGELPVTVAKEAVEWPRNGSPRIAGVSSFGISGTNAHVVLEEAPEEPSEAVKPALERSAELVVLSGKTAGALEEAARRLGAHLEAHPEQSLGDVAYSLGTTRTHHEHRLALSVSTRSNLVELLHAVTRGETPAGAVRDEASEGKEAWLFTGQGSQELGMGRGLYEEWPTFREALEAAWVALDAHLELPLRSVMWAEAGSREAQLLDETSYTQPAVFALGWALSALWQSWGMKPDFALGHSIGEVTAACVAGVFSLED